MFVWPQMRATHATRVIRMREGTFDPLATLAHQSAAFIVPDPVNPASKWLRPNSVLQPIDNSRELNYPAIARAIADTGFTGRGTG